MKAPELCDLLNFATQVSISVDNKVRRRSPTTEMPFLFAPNSPFCC